MKPRTTGQTVGLAFFGSLVCVTLGLGTWQLQRYGWKRELLASRAADLRDHVSETIPEGWPHDRASGKAGSDDSDAGADRVRRVRLTGRSTGAEFVCVGPRPPPAGTPERLIPASGANAGYYLVLPLQTVQGDWVVVNAGWFPPSVSAHTAVDAIRADWASRAARSGEVVVEGMLRLPENPGSWGASHDGASGKDAGHHLTWMDMSAIHRILRLPVPAASLSYVEGIAPLPVNAREGALTRQLDAYAQTHVMPHTHLIYAATWYTLAAAGAAITWRRFTRVATRRR